MVLRKRKAERDPKLYDNIITCYMRCCRKWDEKINPNFKAYAYRCLMRQGARKERRRFLSLSAAGVL